MTVRQAMRLLRERGLIVTVVGRSIYIAEGAGRRD
jgi:DNA-binding GntR family transcriptional regulator